MMAGRGETKPRRVPPGWKATGALSTRRWMVVGAEPVSLCTASEGRADPAGAAVNSCHPSHSRTSSLRGRKSRRQFPNKDLFCNEAGLGRGHRSSLAPLSRATLVTEHRYWLNVSDHSS